MDASSPEHQFNPFDIEADIFQHRGRNQASFKVPRTSEINLNGRPTDVRSDRQPSDLLGQVAAH